MIDKYYTGIGSRKTPKNVLDKMTEMAELLSDIGYTLRSGGAYGADTAFETGSKEKCIIYTPSSNIPSWTRDEVKKYINPGLNFDNFSPYIKRLLQRNMMQILGEDPPCSMYSEKSQFVICWTEGGKDIGGTRYALRCARSYDIPIFNIGSDKSLTVRRLKSYC